MEVVEAGTIGRADELSVVRAAPAYLVPLNTGLRIVAIRRDLQVRPRTMLVEPADQLDEFPLDPISPQAQPVRLDRMNPKLASLPAPNPFRPRIPQQPIRQQPNL